METLKKVSTCSVRVLKSRGRWKTWKKNGKKKTLEKKGKKSGKKKNGDTLNLQSVTIIYFLYYLIHHV